MIHLGLDLGGTKTEVIVLAESGEALFRHRLPTPSGDYEATVQLMVDLVHTACTHSGSDDYTLGVGMPGSISPHSHLVRNANSTCLNGRPLAADLQHRLGHAAQFANDAHCFALSEAVDGAAEDANSVFAVILGTGVGAGLVIDGQAYTGANGIAGEWGHNPLPWADDAEFPGPNCWCGRKGCIETWLSGPSWLTHFENSGGRARNVQDIVQQARAGQALARGSLEHYIHRLGRALAHVMNVIDPEVIVLGGGLSNIDELYEQVPKVWDEYVFSDSVKTCLRPPKYGDSSGVRGAAWLGAKRDF